MIGLLKALTSNYILNVTCTAWLTAQVLKTIINLCLTKKFDAERLVGAGGMPSAHSAFVCSLVMATSKQCGFSAPEFAIALSFAVVVMYDAMGV
ncbi:MAG: divergent PAP2 family protein, partial [Oscillospiraceae bacterium]